MSFRDILVKSWSGRLPAGNGGTFPSIKLEGIGVELVEGVQVFSPEASRILFESFTCSLCCGEQDSHFFA